MPEHRPRTQTITTLEKVYAMLDTENGPSMKIKIKKKEK